MHSAVERALAKSRNRLSLSIVGGQAGISIILAFDRKRPFPVWVAKVASSDETSRKLGDEHAALERLRPWANELSLPVALEWENQAGAACLIFSGRAGFSDHFGLVAESGAPRDGRRLVAALAWLERFRVLVPTGADDSTLRASHGDFWSGNLLFDGDRLSVIDWEGFGARDPLHDVFSLCAHCSYLAGGRVQMDLSPGRFFDLFFTELPAARFIRTRVEGLRVPGQGLARGFYSFVEMSVRIKGGRYRETWIEIRRLLERRGFPEPWSVPKSEIIGR